jgi:hypothetical protein
MIALSVAAGPWTRRDAASIAAARSAENSTIWAGCVQPAKYEISAAPAKTNPAAVAAEERRDISVRRANGAPVALFCK